MTTPSVSHLRQQVTLPIGAGDPHNVIVTVEVDLGVTIDGGTLTVRRNAEDPFHIMEADVSAISAPHTVTATTHKFDLTFALSEAETRAIGTGWRRFGVEPKEGASALGHALAGRIRCATDEMMSQP